MNLQSTDIWESHISDILASPGITAVIGETDTGKTSFCALLSNRALEAGIPVAVVDGDTGQSEIGPPATISAGLVDNPVDALKDIKAESLYFIGSTSPVNHLLAVTAGMKLMTERVQALGRSIVIADTTGLVRGSIARKLKTFKLELLKPKHIVAIQKSEEAEHILRYFDTWQDCTIHRLSPSPYVKPKSKMLRTQRRAIKFMEYFAQGTIHQISLNSIATSCTWLRSGSNLEPRYLKFAENALKTTVYHGEISDSGIYLVTAGNYSKTGITELQEYFRKKNINITPANRYLNLLTGLMDSHLDLLALGIIQKIDFRAQVISIYTPLRSIIPVKSIRLGVLKLHANGTEIGQMRPGEV